MSFSIARTVADLRAAVDGWHADGEMVALVPTMGALHEGHLTLVREARARAKRVVVSVFVNPRQFNNADDLALYPRTEADDAKKLIDAGVDLLFAPDVDEMYPTGFSTTVSVAGVSEGLCGAFRPGHFDGVATVVAKLFLQSRADVALFGEKDYQQLAVIRRMARDLDIAIEVVGVPTVRETDGLAMSSRNARLTPEGRRAAPTLAMTLVDAGRDLENGRPLTAVIEKARADILRAGFTEIEYFELRDADSLAAVETLDLPSRLLTAAWLDGVRLIDNIPVRPRQ